MTTIDNNMQEAVERLRRIETRLCHFITTHGGEVQSIKPWWDVTLKAIVIPGPDARISECLEAAMGQPFDEDGFDVLDRYGEYVATVWRK